MSAALVLPLNDLLEVTGRLAEADEAEQGQVSRE